MKVEIICPAILSLLITFIIIFMVNIVQANDTNNLIENTTQETIQTTINTTIEANTEISTEIITIETTSIEPTTMEITSEISIHKIENNEDNLYWLARVIDREASDVCSDEHKMWTGNVVINRVLNEKYPDSIKDVIFATGQYECVDSGKIYSEPSERSIQAAKRLLNGEYVCNDIDVVYQAEFPQGQEIVKTIYNEYLDSYTYFCK